MQNSKAKDANFHGNNFCLTRPFTLRSIASVTFPWSYVHSVPIRQGKWPSKGSLVHMHLVILALADAVIRETGYHRAAKCRTENK